MRTDRQAQSIEVHDDLDLSHDSMQIEAPGAADAVPAAATPAPLLDRFMQKVL
jgi:hypothetical protein